MTRRATQSTRCSRVSARTGKSLRVSLRFVPHVALAVAGPRSVSGSIFVAPPSDSACARLCSATVSSALMSRVRRAVIGLESRYDDLIELPSEQRLDASQQY